MQCEQIGHRDRPSGSAHDIDNPGTRIDVSGNFDSLFVGADVEQGVVIHPQPKKLTIGGQFLGTYA